MTFTRAVTQMKKVGLQREILLHYHPPSHIPCAEQREFVKEPYLVRGKRRGTGALPSPEAPLLFPLPSFLPLPSTGLSPPVSVPGRVPTAPSSCPGCPLRDRTQMREVGGGRPLLFSLPPPPAPPDRLRRHFSGWRGSDPDPVSFKLAATINRAVKEDVCYLDVKSLDSRHKLRSLEVEIEVYKKSIIKEEEKNELLASILNRSENDANTNKKLIAQSLSKQDAMKVEFGTYTRTLQETEQALSRANTDRAVHLNELVVLRREIEKESETKQDMENMIMAKLQDQMMSNKSAKYFLQLGAKLQNTLLTLDIQLTKIENETAQTSLDITNTNNKLNMLQKNLLELEKDLDDLNSQISHSEAEITKHNLLIGRKQGAINLYNKKLEMFISQLGGQELGPLEIEIKKLTKQIDEAELEVVTLQRHWMKQQRELVKLTQEREQQLTSLDMLKKEITIKEQKKLRVENDIQQEKNELKDIERHMKNMSNDLVKLHLLINKNSENSNELQQGNSIMQIEFLRSLKISERESIEMQEKLDRLHEEKERLVNSLVEAECQMMQWEKKIQIAKEMRAAVNSETGQGEVRAMKSEIHRMQVRHQYLMKQQETLMRDMEAAVSRRETIVVRGEGQSKVNKQVLTKSDFHYKKLELNRKIKESQKNAEECNRTIIQLEESQQNLNLAILEKEKILSLMNSETEELDQATEQLQAKKRQNLSDIVSKQTRVKHMQSVKEGKYVLACRSEIMIRVEHHKVEERLHNVNTILHQIEQEYPHHYKTLRRVTQVITNKLEELTAQNRAEEK